VDDPIVRKRVYVHAGNDEELNRRVETFTSALRACAGVILSIEYRGSFRGRRIAAISYEFPIPAAPASTARHELHARSIEGSQRRRRSRAESSR
jgi:hypothetical protein